VPSAPTALPRGAAVEVAVGEADLFTLDVSARVIRRLDADAAPSAAADATDGAEADDEAAEAAGPLALAIDVADEPDAAEPGGDARDQRVGQPA
jgi:exoribonuclease-2